MVPDIFHFGFKGFHIFIGFKAVVFADALDFYFGEAHQILLGDVAQQTQAAVVGAGLFRRRHHIFAQTLLDGFEHTFPRFTFFYLAVNAFFYKYFFQRSKMPRFAQVLQFYLQFLTEQFTGVLGAEAQHFAYTQKQRLVVADNAGIGRNGGFAVGEGIEGINGDTRRNVGS